MYTQIKEYLINFWIDSQITCSKKQAVVLVVLLAGLAVFFFIRATGKPAEIKDITNFRKGSIGSREQSSYTKILIDISGEVEKPGIYNVPEESRLYSVVEKAGGLSKKADRNAVNLAQKLEDGQKIVIPLKAESAQVGQTGQESQPQSKIININSASAEDLDKLPGIGEVMAQRIVAKREADGPFKKVEDLNDVEGIGPKKFEQIKELISVY